MQLQEDHLALSKRLEKLEEVVAGTAAVVTVLLEEVSLVATEVGGVEEAAMPKAATSPCST